MEEGRARESGKERRWGERRERERAGRRERRRGRRGEEMEEGRKRGEREQVYRRERGGKIEWKLCLPLHNR